MIILCVESEAKTLLDISKRANFMKVWVCLRNMYICGCLCAQICVLAYTRAFVF